MNRASLIKPKYIATVALIALAGLPLAAQKVVRVQRPMVVTDFETPSHSYLGVGVSDLTNDRVQALKLKDEHGVEITQVDQDAPAGKAGLKEHDVIVGFDGTPVESEEQFKRLMRETPAGRTVSLDIVRDGQQQKMKVQLADRKKLESSVFPHEPGEYGLVMPSMPQMAIMPPMPAMPDMPRTWDQTIMRVRSNMGATLESLTSQLGDYFGVKNGEGMLVRSVQKGSPAEMAGLRAGDVVVRVADKKITDNADWREAVRNSKDGKVPVVIVRDKKEQTLTVSVPVRRGPDSSALNREDCPQVEMALNNAFDALQEAGPLVEEGIATGLDAAGQVLTSPEVSEALQKAMTDAHRQLIYNGKEWNRALAKSLNEASKQLQTNSKEIEKALREAQRNIERARSQYDADMQ